MSRTWHNKELEKRAKPRQPKPKTPLLNPKWIKELDEPLQPLPPKQMWKNLE